MREISQIFDRSNPNWSPDHEHNSLFLKTHQNYFNDCLRLRGNVFLNEIYDALGFDRTERGALGGWLRGREDVEIQIVKTNPDGSILINFGGLIDIIYDKL